MEVGGELETPVIGALLAQVSKNIRAENPSAQAITALLSEAHPVCRRISSVLDFWLAKKPSAWSLMPRRLGARKFLEGNPRWLFQFADVTA